MSTIQGKTTFLHLFFAVLLLCVITSQVSANRKHAKRNRLRRQECNDDRGTHDTCVKLIKELGRQVCITEVNQLKRKLGRSCAATCHFCGKPPKDCRRSAYGCCWDAHTPRGDIYGLTGCPECKDHLNLCQRFRKFCNSKKSKSNRAFIELHCPLTCGKCKEKKNVRRRGERIQMNDWRSI